MRVDSALPDSVDRRAARLAVAIAGVAVLAQLLVHVTLLLVDLPVEPTGVPFFANWSWDFLLAWVADQVAGAMLLVALGASFLVAARADREFWPVLGGFAVGAGVYGLTVLVEVVAFGVVYSVPVDAMVVRRFVWRALTFGLLAFVGAYLGDVAGVRYRHESDAEDRDGDHPRW